MGESEVVDKCGRAGMGVNKAKNVDCEIIE